MGSSVMKIKAGLFKETSDFLIRSETTIPCMTVILIVELKWLRDQKLGNVKRKYLFPFIPIPFQAASLDLHSVFLSAFSLFSRAEMVTYP